MEPRKPKRPRPLFGASEIFQPLSVPSDFVSKPTKPKEEVAEIMRHLKQKYDLVRAEPRRTTLQTLRDERTYRFAALCIAAMHPEMPDVQELARAFILRKPRTTQP